MSNAEDIDSTDERLDQAFPAPDADGVAGPVSEPPELVTSMQLKEGADEAWNKAGKEESKGRRGRDSAPESLSSMIVFSVAVMAVVGVIGGPQSRLKLNEKEGDSPILRIKDGDVVEEGALAHSSTGPPSTRVEVKRAELIASRLV
ncbi:hypothetical protein NL676_031241 [Syzygium grande]|nr:hypothetical protein NL676_031241 [Syzygium grande]